MVSESFVLTLIAILIVLVVVFVILKYVFGAFLVLPLESEIDTMMIGVSNLEPLHILNS